jgi:hypothetical protein
MIAVFSVVPFEYSARMHNALFDSSIDGAIVLALSDASATALGGAKTTAAGGVAVPFRPANFARWK